MTLERKRYTGKIAYENEAFPLDFDVWSGEDSRLLIEPQPLHTQVVFKLHSAMGQTGSYSHSLILEGDSADGTSFFSDTVNLHGIKIGSLENTVKLVARKATVTLTLTESTRTPVARRWFRGFQGFRNPTVAMSLGTVEVAGATKPADENEMSGHVTLEAPDSVCVDDWLKRAQAFLSFMHMGLAFAHGGRLQAPRQDIIVGHRWEATYYSGDGFRRSLAPINSLNQGPFIKALAKRFDDPNPFPDMLWTAVGWLHTDSSIRESSFLMSMTALETVVEHVIPKGLTTVIPKAAFKALRSELLKALSQRGLGEEPAKIFEGKIENLNGRSLSQKIQALRDHYALSSVTFSDDAIVGCIKARNDIVHKGQHASPRDLWPNEVFVRELIALIVFKEIGYDGPYESYVNGYRTVHPSRAATATETEASELSGEKAGGSS